MVKLLDAKAKDNKEGNDLQLIEKGFIDSASKSQEEKVIFFLMDESYKQFIENEKQMVFKKKIKMLNVTQNRGNEKTSPRGYFSPIRVTHI